MLTIDPGGTLAGADDRVARRAQNGGGAAERGPDGQAAARKAAGGKRAIELTDAGRDLLLCAMGERGRIGKALLENRAERGQSGGGSRHKRGEKEYPEQIPKARRLPGVRFSASLPSSRPRNSDRS